VLSFLPSQFSTLFVFSTCPPTGPRMTVKPLSTSMCDNMHKGMAYALVPSALARYATGVASVMGKT